MKSANRVSLRCCVVGLLPLLLAASPCVAQEPPHPRPTVSLLAGPSPYDLSGVGTGFAAGAWIDYPVRAFLRVEAGVGYFRYQTQGGSSVAFLLPEGGARIGVPVGRVFPYAGVGAGLASVLTGGEGTELTLHALLGIRASLTARFGLRVEGRLRSVDPWTGNMVDLTGGITVRV